MKLIVNNSEIKVNPQRFLRQAGYGYIESYHTGEGSFVRRCTGNHYPRLHLYVHRNPETVVFNLHLDHKKASYQGAHAHNAEYEGEIVEGELRRLRDLLGAGVISNKRTEIAKAKLKPKKDFKLASAENRLGSGDLNIAPKKTVKKSWLQKLFS